MKKIVITILFLNLFVLLTVSSASAVTPKSRTNAATKGAERQEQVKELRERVATRVAELREKMRRAWSGEIKSMTGKTIVLTTKQAEKTVLTTEETSFFRIGAGARKTITLTNLAVGEKITAFGQVGDDGKMTAKIIVAKVLPININGKMTAVDVEAGTITVQTPKRGSIVVDIETTTKILVWEKGKGLQKSGLSKIKVGDRVHVNGFAPNKLKEGENRITANRILVLPGKAVGIVGSASPSASPTTSPTVRPSASPKSTP